MTPTIQYNAKQQWAIDGPEDRKVIIAPAGSGKTSVLVGAIKNHRTHYPKDHIVAITFTKKAAAELSERIGIMPNAEVSTIHSWAWRRLQSMAAEFNFKVQLLEDEAVKDILKTLCRNRRQFYLNQFQLYSYVMGNYNIDVDQKIKRIFETIRHDYIKYKKKYTLYDFTDLPEYLYDKLNEYEQDITDVEALFVDEFQDIDPIQLQVFDRVLAHKKCYIGDPRQAIYAFRGAVEEVFDQLEGEFTFYDLQVNYRSYQEILDYADTMRKDGLVAIDRNNEIEPAQVSVITPSSIICERGEGANVYIIPRNGICLNLAKPHENASDILTVKRFVKDTKTQILCRTNRQVKKLQAIGIDNVSTIHQAKGLEYDNVLLVSFPVNNMEELNIAYVAATRAKNQLCIVDYDTLLYIVCQEDIKSTTNRLF